MDIFTELLLKDLKSLAKTRQEKFKKLIPKLQKLKKQELDQTVHELDKEIFSDTDCLDCGNCCRTLGPRITEREINKMAKYLKLKPADFFKKYLKIDEDNDYVFKSMPCPFLADDNYCFVYPARPSACREYPHTDKVHFKQILELQLENTEICPVVYKIFTELEKKYV